MKFKYIFIFLIPFLCFNCELSLEEYNTDPTRPTDVGLNLILPEAIASAAYNEGGNQARVAGIVMQQFEGIDAQQLQYTTYVLGENTFDNYWRTGLYIGVLKSCKIMVEKAAEEDRNYYSGVAKIIMAQQLGLGTAYFGDMPWTQAFQGNDNIQPSYDSQESLYAEVFKLLDEAIAHLGQTDGIADYIGGDLIYENSDGAGQPDLWIKTAHGLKARFYLHLSKKDPANFAKAATSVGMSYANAAEQSNLTFDDTDSGNWSLAAFSSERGGTLGIDESFVALMESDPRGAVIMDGSSIDGFWTKNDATVPLIGFTELMFIKAECEAQAGSDPSSSLASAIYSNYETLGVMPDSASVAATADIAGLTTSDQTNAILSEAYKAYFGYNFHETWSNWRRTGFPALTPKTGGSNGSNPSGAIPQRWLYPSSESSTNSANVEAAKASQGGALLDAKLWVFQ